MKLLPKKFFDESAVTLAPKLLGKVVKRGGCIGRIVEVEAYAGDAASHAVKAPRRGILMLESYAHWYVYFTYGMHWCANVTCHEGEVGAILIRAVEPLEGIAVMERRRGTADVRNLCSGPAKFAQAFGITGRDNGKPLAGDFGIFDAPPVARGEVATSPRIGIRQAVELPWRFYVRDNPFVSR